MAADLGGPDILVNNAAAVKLGAPVVDLALDVWNKVIETKMFSFFEFDMAARYLRTGAPSHPGPESAAETI